MLIEFNHLEVFKIVTAPAERMLSIYRGVTGRSVLSIAILNLVLLSMACGDRKAVGLLREKGLVALFLNCIIYLVDCALLICGIIDNNINTHPAIFFISIMIDHSSFHTKTLFSCIVWHSSIFILIFPHNKFLVNRPNTFGVFFNQQVFGARWKICI